MRKTIIYKLAAAAMAILAIYGCSKVETGFISDNIYYNVNPFTVGQGNTAVSKGLVIDGSTTPVNVKLLAVRNMANGQDASKFLLNPDTIRVYTGVISAADSTLALLSKKLRDSAVTPFSVNPVGGRMQFTQATKFVPVGRYNFDLEVSNIRGTRILADACVINVVGAVADSLSYLAYNQSDAAFTNFVTLSPALLNCKVMHHPTGPDQIIYVWKDKNGKNFNPAKGEVFGRPGRPTFADFDPYYPELKTDTSIIYGYPGGVPSFPVFTVSRKYPTYACGPYYYSINGKNTANGLNANTTLTVNFFQTKGTYVVTITVTDITRTE